MTAPADDEPAAVPRRTVRCPRCGGPSLYAPDNAYRPFCSARCKDTDFGAWASEAYRIAAPPAPPGDGDGDGGHDEDGTH